MRPTWRWFGPADQVSVDDMLQAGVQGVVSALHHVPTGALWEPQDIAQRQQQISCMKDGTPSGLKWEVVESLPISEAIKKQSANWREHVSNYIISLRNLAAADIKTVCYNFMPVLDWTRTDVAYRLPNGATCMRFDLTDFAIFDIHILERADATADYADDIVEKAHRRFTDIDQTRQQKLADNVICGLPGAADRYTIEDVRQLLAEYQHITADKLRANLIAFLEQVVPVAQEAGINLCCHPDDPPVSLLGLPRIMSTEADFGLIMQAVDMPANGITLCSGSLGARPDNDLPGMMKRLGSRVHFLHLRNVTRETSDIRGSFYEAEHIGGDTDMVALIDAILTEEERRAKDGKADSSIPFRPDHGQAILDDLTRDTQPGYPAVGRLKGLAELRGISAALMHRQLGSRCPRG